MPFHPEDPFNDLPLLPPRADLETKAILKQCIAANKALAELKGVGDLIPNQAMLINAIPLQEAKLSSEIENILTTQDKLYRAAVQDSQNIDPHTKEILRYRTALRSATDQLAVGRISIELVERTCSLLRDEPVTVRDLETVYIADRQAGAVIYTPPVGRAVLRTKLQNLIDYLNSPSDTDPLIRMAVMHYQFEAIHPFTDGSGRTGRILNIAYLLQEKLINIPVLFLSRYILDNKLEYYSRLRGVTERMEWEALVLYLLRAVEETARLTTIRIHAIRALFEATLERARRDLPPSVYSKELIELVFSQPYRKIKFLVDAGIAKRQAASVYLQKLEELGIVEGERVGREIVYLNPSLIRILSE
jgi:Fic family protein